MSRISSKQWQSESVKFLHSQLIVHEDIIAALKQYFKSDELTEGMIKLATIPKSAKLNFSPRNLPDLRYPLVSVQVRISHLFTISYLIRCIYLYLKYHSRFFKRICFRTKFEFVPERIHLSRNSGTAPQSIQQHRTPFIWSFRNETLHARAFYHRDRSLLGNKLSFSLPFVVAKPKSNSTYIVPIL